MASDVQEPMPVWLNEDELRCSICLDTLSNPATVECGHSFCLDCIQDWLKRQDGKCECPNCKRRVSPKLPQRAVLLDLILKRYKGLASSDPLPLGTSRPAEPGFPDGARRERDFSPARRSFQDYMVQTRNSISEAFSFMKKCICDQEKMVLRIIEEEWNVAQQITDSTEKQLNGKIHNILDLQNNFEEAMKKASAEQEAYIGDSIQKISNIAIEELRRQLEAAILRNFPVQPSQIPKNDSLQEASSSSSSALSPRDRELPMISSSFSQYQKRKLKP